jgi:osmoprotectant transport system ATP-binding protein
MSIARNVAVPLRLAGRSPGEIKGRVDELLSLVHLPPEQFARRMPAQLSGGQRQRVGFARALAAEPRVMLLDEPFGALDPVTRDEIQAEFKRIQAEVGFAAVLVTHDMTEALLMATRIVVIRDGVVAQAGTPAELLNRPADDYIETLISSPRRQARRLDELMDAGDAP